MILLENLEVVFGGRPVLAIDSLRILAGERVAIIGSSGAGKSTLLRCIKGFIPPGSGKVEVLGINVNGACRRSRISINRKIAFIYQQFRLAPRLSVLQNTLCGRLGLTSGWRSLLGWFSMEDKRVSWAAIVEVGLADKIHQRADTLSGGEQQRVAVARALAQQPSLVLADEPVSSLDPAWAIDVLNLLTTVQTHHQTTMIITLHQPELARRFAGRVIGLRAGKIFWDGPATDLTDDILHDLYDSDRNRVTPLHNHASA